MRIENFDFHLPRDYVASRPAIPRESAKLLLVGETGDLIDSSVRNLPDSIKEGDLLVFNDTRVINALLKGRQKDGIIEVTLHKRVAEGIWKAFARPAKKVKQDEIFFSDEFTALVTKPRDRGEIVIDFRCSDTDLYEKLKRYGQIPLPPYIRRLRDSDALDVTDYQTIFAENEGAVASPTAGLHFTDNLLKILERKSVNYTTLTLHVGAGTFLPVKEQNPEMHVMHSEYGEVSSATADQVNRTKSKGGRIIAVGTTTLRLLESAVNKAGKIAPFKGETDIFIRPGYQFRSVDVLITNFHLPRSTLFMLVCAFSGMEEMHRAYDHAINRNYRFYSYGDACLLHRRAKGL